MAHGILLFLALPVAEREKPSEIIVQDLRHSVTGMLIAFFSSFVC
jgi:hypothetical protein